MLLSPFVFKSGATAKNRVALAPLTNKQSHAGGTLSDAEHAFLARRSAFGVVTTCAAHVAADGQGWPGELGIHDDAHLPGLQRLAGTLSAAGALGVVQLFHGGTRAPEAVTGSRPWSASEQPEDPAQPRAATEADIERVIGQFARAAARAAQAGFAGVELHAAHGYLLSQFLSATQNRRDDAWGRDRSLLVRTVLREVRAAVREATGPSSAFLVGVRISPEDFGQARGLDLDESLELSQALVEGGADYLHLSLWDVTRNTAKRPTEHPLSLFRAAVPGASLMVAGKVWTRADAEACLDRGADFVALGRAGIVNPDWPTLAADPAWQPVMPPVTAEHLLTNAVAPGFVEYLRAFKGFLA